MTSDYCDACPSYYYARNRVMGEGDKKAKMVIVSDMPWKSEVAAGRPFIGSAGQLLFHTLRQFGLEREEFYITNACKCPVKDVKMDTVRHCTAGFLEKELDSCKEKQLIIAMGEKALRTLLPNVKEGVMKMCGKIFYSERYRCDVLACMNPARVLQQERDFQLFRATLSKIPNAASKIDPVGDFLPPILSNPHVNELEKMKGRDVCLDIETNSTLDYMDPYSIIESIAFCDGLKVLIYDTSYFDKPHFWRAVRGTKIIAHNGPFDLIFILAKYGIDLHLENDTMMMAFAMAESFGTDEEGGYSLEKLCCIYLGVAPWKSIAKKRGYTDEEYQAKDVYYCWLLWKMWISKMPPIYSKLYMPLTNLRVRAEYGGVNVDVPKCRKMHERFEHSLKLLRESMQRKLSETDYFQKLREISDYNFKKMKTWEIIAMAVRKTAMLKTSWLGKQITKRKNIFKKEYEKAERSLDYNPNSDIQNKAAFSAIFKHMGLKVKLTGTARDLLLPYKDIPFFKAYIPYTKLNTLATTFLSLKNLREDGKVHPTKKIHGTVTGRISMAKPNMQNIPGKVRHIYIPDSPNQVWLKPDYDQLEMKVAVALGNLKELIDEINKGFDFHTVTAILVTEKDPKDITKIERRIAKNVNFGCLFDGSDETIQHYMELLGKKFSLSQVREFRERYFAQFEVWRQKVIKQGMKDRFVETEFGSRRRFFLVTKKNYKAVCREMVNTKIQGTAAQMTLFRFLEIEEGLRVNYEEARALFSVHDEVDCICRKEDAKDVALYIKNIMERRFHFTDLTFTADVEISERWH